MSFNSLLYLVFVVACAALANLSRSPRVRFAVLLVSSYVFYASFSPFYLLLLIAVGSIVSLAAADGSTKTARIYGGIAALLVILVLFRSEALLVATREALVRAKLGWLAPSAGVPLGLSFYIFEAIGYLVERSKGREAAYGMGQFQLFMAFFPHLLSGPIMKARDFMPQIAKRPTLASIGKGVWYVASGLALKVVLADQLAPSLDTWFRSPSGLTLSDTAVLSLGFGVQMYLDFSGYSRVAIGSAAFFGIDLVENFNHPFLATSPADFWNRWHISLSRWIRDYVFLRIVGRRRSLGILVVAAMTAMLLCGAWHGFTLKFIVWGLFHGSVVALYHVYRRTFGDRLQGWADRRGIAAAVMNVAGWGLTTLVLLPGWALFRTPDVRTAVLFFQSVARVHGRVVPGQIYAHVLVLFFAIVAIPLVGRAKRVTTLLRPLAPYGRSLAVGALLALVLLYTGTSNSFVYFQF